MLVHVLFGLLTTSLMSVICLAAIIPETKESKLARATNDFGFDLMRSLKHEKNVFVSPFSVGTALALVYLGAEGNTLRTMRKTLNYDKYDLADQDVHETFRSILTNTRQNNENYQLSTYNSALVEENCTVLDFYDQALYYFYSAQIKKVDFVHQAFRIKDIINEHVEEATHNKIKNFLTKPPAFDTRLLLLNAVYFLGNWNQPFSPEHTHSQSFYNNGVQETMIQMMKQSGNYKISFKNNLDSIIVALPYLGEKTASMIIVLPNERTGVNELQQVINQSSLNKALDTLQFHLINLNIPKFSLSYATSLDESLHQMGLEEIFGDHANFNHIAGEDAKLKVTGIFHKAAIDVNEKGSEASSATDVEFTYRNKPSPVIINHPFLFFVVDDRNGMILFSGRVDEL